MNYWLSPQGQVWKSDDLGRHYEMAVEIIREKFPEFLDPHLLESGIKMHDSGRNAIADLESKGYIRYMDWGYPSWVIKGKPNRIQIDKMFKLTGFIYER